MFGSHPSSFPNISNQQIFTPTTMSHLLPMTRRLVTPTTFCRTSLCSSIGHQSRKLHSSGSLLAGGEHTSDSYSKDVDSTPASEKSVHRLDPDSDKVQKPNEPPSGPWSRAGVQTEEYRHVEGSKEPYTAKEGIKGRYGARSDWAEEKGPETSSRDDGPEGKSSGGRK